MRVPRRLARVGAAADLPDAAAFDAYTGPAGELTVDHVRGIIALHNGVTPGGIQYTQGGGDSAGVYSPPQGRLSLQSGVPVMSANYSGSAADELYYVPFVGDAVPIWNGSNFNMRQFSELAMPLSATYHAANTNYDVYIINDGGTLRLGTGPAWSSDNARGSGAGTAELETLRGVKVNKNAVTARWGNAAGNTIAVGARNATVVGTIRTVAGGQTEFTIAPAPAAGGTNNKLFVSNIYNRVPIISVEIDTTTNWTRTAVGFGPANGNVNNRISFIDSIGDMAVMAEFNDVAVINANGAGPYIQIGLDSTTVGSGSRSLASGPAGLNAPVQARYEGVVGPGLHYLQAMDGNIAAAQASYTGAPFYRLSASLLL